MLFGRNPVITTVHRTRAPRPMDFIVPDGMNVNRPDRYVRDIGDDGTSKIIRDVESTGNVLRVLVDGDHFVWQYGTFIIRIKLDSILAASLSYGSYHGQAFRCFTMQFGYRTDGSVILLSTFDDASEWFAQLTTSLDDMLPCPIADTGARN